MLTDVMQFVQMRIMMLYFLGILCNDIETPDASEISRRQSISSESLQLVFVSACNRRKGKGKQTLYDHWWPSFVVPSQPL